MPISRSYTKSGNFNNFISRRHGETEDTEEEGVHGLLGLMLMEWKKTLVLYTEDCRKSNFKINHAEENNKRIDKYFGSY